MRRKTRRASRRICFVTGTRAEFGLMRPVLEAIGRRQLRIVVTGMHLDRGRGRTIDRLCQENWRIDAVVDWEKSDRALAVGRAISELAKVFNRLKPQVVLVTGDGWRRSRRRRRRICATSPWPTFMAATGRWGKWMMHFAMRSANSRTSIFRLRAKAPTG